MGKPCRHKKDLDMGSQLFKDGEFVRACCRDCELGGWLAVNVDWDKPKTFGAFRAENRLKERKLVPKAGGRRKKS